MIATVILLLASVANAQFIEQTIVPIRTETNGTTAATIVYGTDYILTCAGSEMVTTDPMSPYESRYFDVSAGSTLCSPRETSFVYNNATDLHVTSVEGAGEITVPLPGGSLMNSDGFNIAGSRYAICDATSGEVTIFDTSGVPTEVVDIPGFDGACLQVGFTTTNDGEVVVVLTDQHVVGFWTVGGPLAYESYQNLTVANASDIKTAWHDDFYVQVSDSVLKRVEYVVDEWVIGGTVVIPDSPIKYYSVGKNDGTLAVVRDDNNMYVHHQASDALFEVTVAPVVINGMDVFDFTNVVVLDDQFNVLKVSINYATDAPTSAPTGAPSSSPTKTPTHAPTPAPTNAPTNAPTTTAPSPTNQPTTRSPTSAPTTAVPTTASPTSATTTAPSPTTTITYPTIIVGVLVGIFLASLLAAIYTHRHHAI